MMRCIELAGKGRGIVSPNPLVGSVIVKDKKIIGEGWHLRFGEAHAEAVAIANCRGNLSGSTLYCNLEPCSHTNKKTPPCTPLIIKSGIKKVVIANIDPNPQVNGRSVEMMKKAGIIVEKEIMEMEGRELNRFFFKYIQNKQPWVNVKIAQSLDGKIGLNRKKQTWITGPESAKYVHRLRAEYDAVLVGAGTIKADNPQLNVRHVKGRNPIIIILDGRLTIDPSAKVFQKSGPQNILIFCLEDSLNSGKASTFKDKAKIVGLTPSENGNIKLNTILKYLGESNITSVLVEGGQSIFSQFMKDDLYDEITVLQSPEILGTGIDCVTFDRQVNLKLNAVNRYGSDCCLNYRKEIAH